MVKGTSRRVIVVDAPDTKLFEQAIFIVRNDAAGREGVTAQELVNEACRVAKNYTRAQDGGRGARASLMPWLWCAAGACASGIVWLVTTLL